MERCVTCHYYDRHNGKANDGKALHAGQCRKTAPQLNPVNAKTYMVEGVWPTVRDDDWCGEWKALVRRVDPSRINEVLNATGAPPRTASAEAPPRATVLNATPIQPAARSPLNLMSPPAAPSSAPSLSSTPVAFGAGRGD